MPERPNRFRRSTARAACRAAAALCAAGLLLASRAPPAQDLDVPFVTTPDPVVIAMLELAGLTSSDHLIDLGSGDGRIAITAAQRFRATAEGYEIVPDLVEKSRATARRAGVADRTEFHARDLFKADLSKATVVTMYLLPDVNLQLRPRLLALAPGTRIVSHDWDMGDWRADAMRTVDAPDKAIGREKLSRLFLWIVPAQVEGRWCGTGRASGASLAIEQAFQRFRAVLQDQAARRTIEGRISGENVEAQPLQLGFSRDRLEVRRADAPLAAWRGAAFERCR